MAKKSQHNREQARQATINRVEMARQHKALKKKAKADRLTTYEKAMSREDPPLIEKLNDFWRNNGGPYEVADPNLRHLGPVAARALLPTLTKKGARFLNMEYVPQLRNLVDSGQWCRPVEDWKPRGRGRDAQFRSLVKHLFCEYPVPHFLFQVFDIWGGDLDRRNWLSFFSGIGRGGSASNLAKKYIPIPMTKKMVHRFMQTTGKSSLLSALRMIQATEYATEPGWGLRLHAVLIATYPLDRLNSPSDEAFWETVIRFFARQAMLDPHEVGPYFDYISHARQENENWSMKGRNITSLTRDRDEWHRILHKMKRVSQNRFKPSGFVPKMWRAKRNDNRDGFYAYAIEEILTTKNLANEGRLMKHCVYSYASSIVSGRVSIWSLRRWSCHKNNLFNEKTGKMEFSWIDSADWSAPEDRLITIEVDNSTNTIVQCRGKLNRAIKSNERTWVINWAKANGLKMRTNI